MRMPNADRALVEKSKVVDYLLNEAHRYGASKARFFTGFGFTVDRWEVLAEALREHARTGEVSKMKQSRFGTRYEVEGELVAPDGRRPRIVTVWQLDAGKATPRLITAYPLERPE